MGLTQLGASYFEVKPGESALPAARPLPGRRDHLHPGGEGTYRFGAEAYPVKAGDVLSAPAGRTEYAHQLTNTGTATLKYVCVSSLPEINVVELPELGVSGFRAASPAARPASS